MKKWIIAVFATLLFAMPAMAKKIKVSVTNLTNGIYFTPLLLATHPHDTHLFESGTVASDNLQMMAEGGDTSGLSHDLEAVSAHIIHAPGLLGPGESTRGILRRRHHNTHLSIVGMLLPSNDGFVGLNALKIPRAKGVYRYFLKAYDAGTEANDEVINGGGAPGTPGIPADPGGNSGSGGTGMISMENNTSVHIHRGVIGDDDLGGGASDLTSTVHRWLNPVALVVITVK